jgi:hypothetical protein
MKNSYRVWVGGVLDAENLESYDEAWRIFMSWVARGYDDVIVENSYGKVVNRHNRFYDWAYDEEV